MPKKESVPETNNINDNSKKSNEMTESIYEIKINSIDNKALDLISFKGKKLLIVNVASECGYTPQYEQLQELYELHQKDLTIIGCPSNDFGGQEPGNGDQIAQFCKKNYGVTFPLTEKVGITKSTHPLYQWLTQKEKNGVADGNVKWNFHKFLVEKDGTLYKELPSSVSPLDEQILDWISK
jgi:glutathione peroxidase